LEPDAQYWYRLKCSKPGSSNSAMVLNGTFHTQRDEGSTSRFTITADSHIIPRAFRSDSAGLRLYATTLGNVLADSPDFNIDMGDFAHIEFHAGRNAKSQKEAFERYLFQRAFLQHLAGCVPFYFVLGNHEGE